MRKIDVRFWAALKKGDHNVVLECLQEGANIDLKDFYGWPPLCYSANAGNIRITQILIEHGANINATNNYKRNALHCQCESIYIDFGIIDYLIKKGIDLNATDIYGRTPLYYAIHKDKTKIIRLLIESGANVNVKDINGNTPLHLALRFARNSYLFLVEKGANPYVKNDCGEAPIDIVRNQEQKTLIVTTYQKGVALQKVEETDNNNNNATPKKIKQTKTFI